MSHPSEAVDGALGTYPYLNAALSNTLVPIAGVRPVGSTQLPREIYTAVLTNPSAALAYMQVFSPTIAGNAAGQASLGTPGAQTGVLITLDARSGVLANGNSVLLNIQTASETVTITALSAATQNFDGTSTYTASFTTTKAHPISGPISVMGGITLGTTAPKQSYGVGAGLVLPLLFGDMGQGYPLGIVIAATTLPTGAAAPATAMVASLGYA